MTAAVVTYPNLGIVACMTRIRSHVVLTMAEQASCLKLKCASVLRACRVRCEPYLGPLWEIKQRQGGQAQERA